MRVSTPGCVGAWLARFAPGASMPSAASPVNPTLSISGRWAAAFGNRQTPGGRGYPCSTQTRVNWSDQCCSFEPGRCLRGYRRSGHARLDPVWRRHLQINRRARICQARYIGKRPGRCLHSCYCNIGYWQYRWCRWLDRSPPRPPSVRR